MAILDHLETIWHEPDNEAPDLVGLGYPALDPESGTQVGGGPDQRLAAVKRLAHALSLVTLSPARAS